MDISKKPKTPKKKKRKDPNEPVKPVSAYALFFRDTQANIKAQNPNATFGEVSKIVASMWDGLGEEQKQVDPPSLIRSECLSAYIQTDQNLKVIQHIWCGVNVHLIKNYYIQYYIDLYGT